MAKRMGDAALEAALAALPSLYNLDLRGVGLDAEDVATLVAALRAHAQLRLNSVCLANNRFNNECASHAVQAVLEARSCAGVGSLDLSWNCISHDGARALAAALQATGHGLTSLDLDCNDLLDAGLAELAAALPRSRLRTLRLGGNRIGALGARSLAAALPSSSLEVLDLSRNQLGPAGATAIAAALTAPGCGAAGAGPSARSVGAQPHEPRQVPGCTLRSLSLAVNRIGDEGAKALAGALRGAALLELLELANNMIGDRGAESLAEALSEADTSLTTLGLARNRLTHIGAAALAKAADSGRSRRLHSIELQGNTEVGGNLVTEVAFALRKNCHSIMLFDPLQAALEMCRTGAYSLDLTGISLGREGAKQLAGAMGSRVRVSRLDLGNTDLEDEGLAHIAGVLSKSRGGVSELDVSWNRVALAGALALAAALQAAGGCPLVELSLENNNLGDAGAVALAQALMKKSKAVHKDVDEVSATLRVLNLAGNGIGLAGAVSLAGAVCGAAGLWELELGRNRLGPRGAAALAAALAEPEASLKTLGLAVNRVADEGAKALAQGLAARPVGCPSPALALNLRSNLIGDAGVAALGQSLASGAPFTTLHLDYNRVTGIGVTALASALRQRWRRNASGKGDVVVSLEGNPGGVDARALMEEALKEPETLGGAR